MRFIDDLVRVVRNLLLAIDELKTTQLVGSSQIVAKPYTTTNSYDKQVNVVAPFQGAGSSFKSLKINVIPSGLTSDNILISELIPDVRLLNGTRVSQWNSSNNQIDYNQYYFVVKLNPEVTSQNTYFMGIVAPTNTTMRIKLKVVANSDLTFTIEELN